MTLLDKKCGDIIAARKLEKSYRQIANLVSCNPKTVGNEILQRTISHTLCKANLFAHVAVQNLLLMLMLKKNIGSGLKSIFTGQLMTRKMFSEEFDDDWLVPAIKSKEIIVWGCFSCCYTIYKLQDQYPNSNRPPYSSDLSPIENLWMVKEEWEALSQHYYKHLVESEVDRVME
ncbi:34371_t:CDS:2, partial [Racocetra persica]